MHSKPPSRTGTDQPWVTVVLLAAGESRRFGDEHKLLARLNGRNILQESISRAGQLHCHELLVVTGAERQRIESVARGMFESWSAKPIPRCVFNEDFQSGMANSIACGVRAAAAGTAILVWPSDMPVIEPSAVEQVLERRSETSIVIPVFGERRGHPVLFGPSYRDELVDLGGDFGARPIIDRHPESIIEVHVGDPGVIFDVDTEEELEEARRMLGKPQTG